jgi:membrane protein YqaA with SNARE-associated domain
MDSLPQLIGLFLSAMLAASPIPMQSEIIFVAMQTAEAAPIWIMIAVAGFGNTVGALVTYGLGRGVNHWRDRRWFPATPAQMARAEHWYDRWGLWTLLLSWAPGGDLACLVAGVLRLPLVIFIPLVAAAKTARYAVVAWLTAQAMGLAG